MKISIVIPAHNEEGNLERLISQIVPVLESHSETSDFEIILVDDNSTDRTPGIIDDLSEHDPRIIPIHRKENPGFGNAIISGFRKTTGEIIIPVMGDLSDDPKDLPLLVRKIEEGYDIAYGSRFIEGGMISGYPSMKLFANRAFNNLVRYSFGILHRDITNALKAYRREVLDTIGIDTLESKGFDLTVEIPIKAHILGFRSAEVPVHWYGRTEGDAKLKLSRNGPVYGRRFLKLFIYGNFVALKDLFHLFFKGSTIGLMLALLVGIIILLILFSLAGFPAIISILEQINWYWIFAGCGAIVLSFVIRTWRWDVILRSAGYAYHMGILFKCLMFGWFLNYLVPARLGDIARCAALKTTSDAPLGMTLSTVVIERILDMVVIAGLLGVASLVVYKESFFYIEIGSFLIIAVLLFLLLFIYNFDEKIGQLFEKWIPSLPQSLDVLKKGLRNIVRNPKALALCCVLSVPVWLLEIASIYFAARSVGYPLPFVDVTIAGVVAFLAQALPLTPAGIGIHEASITGVLMLFSVPGNIGMTIALVDHFTRGLVICILGIISTIHIAFASRYYFRRNRVS